MSSGFGVGLAFARYSTHAGCGTANHRCERLPKLCQGVGMGTLQGQRLLNLADVFCHERFGLSWAPLSGLVH